MSRKKTTAEFVAEAQAMHGLDKFTYDRVQYASRQKDVEIGCLACGCYFWQRPSNHLRKSKPTGCPICANESLKGPRFATEEFIKRVEAKHGKDKFDFGRAQYAGAHEQTEIGCLECGSYFWPIANNLVNGHGCPVCAVKIPKNPRVETEEFIKRAEAKHGVDAFDYSRVKSVGMGKKVEIGCLECGQYFWQTASSHCRGHGCPKCAGIERVTTEEFIKRAEAKHGVNRFDYGRVICIGNRRSKVEIGCQKCGEYFWQAIGDHLRGSGCSLCTPRGFNPDKTALLYYVRFDLPSGDLIYKIGITNRTVQERFSNEPLPYRILQETPFLFGWLAREREQEILAQYAGDLYDGEALVSGNTEAFVRDVLNLDKPRELSA